MHKELGRRNAEREREIEAKVVRLEKWKKMHGGSGDGFYLHEWAIKDVEAEWVEV